MKKKSVITHLFVDIGGVLLTNGWDHLDRKKASKEFKLDWEEMDEKHRLIFDPFEQGKFTLDDYLNKVIFYKKRSFTKAQFRSFMFAQSQIFPEMITLIRQLKDRYGLKVFALSNEARELNDYRIKKFKLGTFIDAFVSSCYVHLRKPNPEIFQLALDIAQAPVAQTLYLENTAMFVEIAESLGIQSILHTDYTSTCKKFSALGLKFKEDNES